MSEENYWACFDAAKPEEVRILESEWTPLATAVELVAIVAIFGGLIWWVVR